MRRSTCVLAAAAVVAAALVAPVALQAHDSAGPRGNSSPTGTGMMNMGRMGQMMDHRSRMMQSARMDAGRPNDQWRDGTPPANHKNDEKQ